MARYFYDRSVGTNFAHDADGVVCRDDKAALRNGQIALSDLLSKHEHVVPWQHFEIIIRREDGAAVGRLTMTVIVETQNPATAAALSSQRQNCDKAELTNGSL